MIGATGLSRGGGMTVNVATFHDTLDLPSFDGLAAFVASAGQSMSGIDTSTKIMVINSEENALNYPSSQELFDSLWHIPCSNKNFIQVNSDYYGTPHLIADHNFSGSGYDTSNVNRLNTLDFFGSWKYTVGVFNCVFKEQDCEYCYGNDTLITYMGTWSDGTPINTATIMDTCEIVTFTENHLPLKSENIVIYPNPSNKIIHLKTQAFFGSCKISIFSILGKKIYECKDQKQIDISLLKSGTYFIEIEVDNFMLLI